MGFKLDVAINENYSKLNSVDIYILTYIQNNLHECTSLSIAELAKRCSVSTATILRMAQKLNFSGYSEFKYFLKDDEKKNSPENINMIDILNKDISQTMKFFQQNKHIQEICQIINTANTIYAYGTGQGQNLMLQEAARCFFNVNKKFIMVPSSTELKILKKFMSTHDLLFIASWSGNIDKYRDTLINLSILDIPIVSITSFNNNELSSLSKYNLYFQSTHVDVDMNVNRSSYLTLHLVLHLLYDAYVDYMERLEQDIRHFSGD